MEFVFIIGVARTGSKIYRNIINHNTNINILNELHYRAPRWIRKDFITSTRGVIDKSRTTGRIEELVDFLYSNNLVGTFWKTDKWEGARYPNNITGIEKEKLKDALEKTDLEYGEVLRVIIEEHTRNQKKETGGAKFPVEISCVPELREWFPDSKLLHITRDPRGIYASMIYGDFKDRKKRGIMSFKPVIRIYRMIYLYNQYNKAYKIHNDYSNDDNYHLSRFEDMVIHPRENIQEICDFLNVQYRNEMMYPPVVNSSFNDKAKKKGLDSKAATRWKNKLSGFEKRFIKTILKKQMRAMGY